MSTRITRTLGALAATAALTVALTACSSAKDTANDAHEASQDAATSAYGAASAVTGANGSGSESPAAVPSTIIATPGGTEVTITDGPIIGEYAKYGYEKGHLGAPLGPVSALPDGKGKYLTLKGGTIYWSEASGAHVVHGLIGDKWGDAGHEAGDLGYPTSDETAADGAIKQTFQNGTITFHDGVATVS